MNIVELRNVTIVQNDRQILKNVTWVIRKGEHWALIGPNGSGKTTLLRLINGYLWPSSGRASVLGRTFGTYDLRELRKRIGFISSFIHERIPAGLKVLDVVLSGRSSSLGVFDEPTKTEVLRARSRLASVRCDHLAEASYGTLSQGEKQRVIIARVLMSSPQLLTLDEPCSGLDLSARESFLKLLDKIGTRKRSPTMIFATHRIEEIVPGFTHAIIIRDGKIVRSGPKKRVIRSDAMSKAFSLKVEIVERGGRYRSFT